MTLQTARFKNIEVIINPAAGSNEPILNTLHDVFKDYDVDWNVSLTKRADDGAKLAKAALERGVDLVAAYGGDGTLLDVAIGMMGTKLPMAFLPGGTANALAAEMGLPNTLAEAARVIVAPEVEIRTIDMGRVGEDYFLLRVGTGLVANFSAAVNREMKDKYGLMAYFIGGLQALTNPAKAIYKLIIDGKVQSEVEAVALLISNGNATGGGAANLPLSPYIKIDDGLLDVFALRGDLNSILGVVGNITAIEGLATNLDHWQGSIIQVDANLPQLMYGDGEEEPISQTPCTIEVLAGVLQVVVLPSATI